MLIAVVIFVALALLLILLDRLNIQDPTEGGATSRVVNYTPGPVRLAVCVNERCTRLAAGGGITRPGRSLLQNLSPHDRVPLLVRPVGAGSGIRECRHLVVGATVQDRYALSGLRPCANT
jgi:hypothetical protein